MKLVFMSFLFSISFLMSNSAKAEYRVFLLKISKKNPTTPPPTGSETAPTEDHVFESTLDPEQYRSYFPLQSDENISYTETWRCYGRTGGGLPHCPNPQRQPSSDAETNSQNPALKTASPP